MVHRHVRDICRSERTPSWLVSVWRASRTILDDGSAGSLTTVGATVVSNFCWFLNHCCNKKCNSQLHHQHPSRSWGISCWDRLVYSFQFEVPARPGHGEAIYQIFIAMTMNDVLYASFLLPVFLTIECTRSILYVSDRTPGSGPLRLVVLLLNILAFGPLRVIFGWVLMVIWLPVRALLWFMGIGRGAPKKGSAAATARFYEFKRRRAEGLEEQTKGKLIWRIWGIIHFLELYVPLEVYCFLCC